MAMRSLPGIPESGNGGSGGWPHRVKPLAIYLSGKLKREKVEVMIATLRETKFRDLSEMMMQGFGDLRGVRKLICHNNLYFMHSFIYITYYTPHTDPKVLADLRRITGDSEYLPSSASELCNRILVTCYMGTENSSNETKQRAISLAAAIGRY
ncbi:hypothetical protein NQ318_021729 [Aromia moschata]|uniref:Uncharacterized protein n=1 Tax=Aromia moschata TaxID=1265417 RepID=A0AAV8XZB1_9CUCU|nr:hypothetical protein NQ318_021729 [Aromia moschata]